MRPEVTTVSYCQRMPEERSPLRGAVFLLFSLLPRKSPTETWHTQVGRVDGGIDPSRLSRCVGGSRRLRSSGRLLTYLRVEAEFEALVAYSIAHLARELRA